MKARLLGFICLLLFSQQALATQLFNFTFAGNGATAVGSFDLNHTGNTLERGSYIIDTGVGGSGYFPTISNINVTVSGAAAGNGIFGPTGFADLVLRTDGPLDLTRDLVGQQSGPCLFGNIACNVTAGTHSSDFNVFGNGAPRPNGINVFTLAANNGFGTQMTLQSVRMQSLAPASLPEASTWGMMIIGFGLMGAAFRRQPIVPTGLRSRP